MGALELGSKFTVESPLAWVFVPVARPVRDDRLVSRYISRPQPHATDLHGFFMCLQSSCIETPRWLGLETPNPPLAEVSHGLR